MIRFGSIRSCFLLFLLIDLQKPPKHWNLRAATHNLKCCVFFGLEYPLVAEVFQDGNKVTPQKPSDMTCLVILWEEILHQLRLVISCSSLFLYRVWNKPAKICQKIWTITRSVWMIGSFRTWDFLVGNVVVWRSCFCQLLEQKLIASLVAKSFYGNLEISIDSTTTCSVS